MHSICPDYDSDADVDWDRIDHTYADLHSPSAASPDLNAQSHGYDDGSDGSAEEYGGSTTVQPRVDQYFSRIEQYLHDYPSQPILIVDGGKSAEGGGKYIVYTIRTGVSSFRSN